MRPPVIRLYEDEGILDGFAGGGGASTGIEMAIGRSPDVAINHDATALAMHEANHPETRHIQSNIRKVSYKKEMRGKRCAFAWFSPDCTFFSKARGGTPFRDRDRARRIRGLAWEVVRCAIEIRPRMIFMENVEEFKDWCPLGRDGRPDPAKKGSSFRRWVSRLRNLGAEVEYRELRASHYGAPTSRKRLFVIIRFDGLPIVWPEPTHGPGLQPYRTAAECIDFDLPVPSIFLAPAQAKAWGQQHGVAAPKRPLAAATKRRIARGTFRYVLNTPEPFIVRFNTERGEGHTPRGQSLDEPLSTLDTSNRFGLVQPTLSPLLMNNSETRHDQVKPADEPIPTLTALGCRTFQLVTPILAPLLINTRNGERKGQAPRVLDITKPFTTITAVGSQGALVAAFLAKHNGGHEATGQRLERPIAAVTCRDSKAVVTSHLVKLRGGHGDHVHTAQDVREPAPTLTAGGTHVAEVRATLVPRESIDAAYLDRAVETCAFLVKFFGTGVARPVDAPAGTLTTKDRIGLVTVILVNVGGAERVLVDIGMRMLTPRELFRCQGFPADYEIEHVPSGPAVDLFGTKGRQKLTKKAQTRLVGNSVPPHVAAALIGANLAPATPAGAVA
jgi:DNA (cytosine-5)-methyltransferase 1